MKRLLQVQRNVPRRLLVVTLMIGVLLGLYAACYGATKPLGSAPTISFPREVPLKQKQATLDGSFQIVTRMNDLPASIQNFYREEGGDRFVMADRGRNFEVTDVITDGSLPRKRLIFAAISKDRCIVHYESGGIGHSYSAAAFSLPDAKPLWYAWVRGAASDLQDLRRRLESQAAAPQNKHS